MSNDIGVRLHKAAAPFAAKLAELGFDPADPPSPLDLMLRVMYWRLAKGDPDAQFYAGEIAGKVAPYLHPRLGAMDVKGSVDERVTVNIVRFSDGQQSLQNREPITIEARKVGDASDPAT